MNIKSYLKAGFVFVTTTAAFLLVKMTGIFPSGLWLGKKNELEKNAVALMEEKTLTNVMGSDSSLIDGTESITAFLPMGIVMSISNDDIKFEELKLSKRRTVENIKLAPMGRKLLSQTPSFTQFPTIVELSSLNVGNEFVLNGETANDYSGFSVNSAGDVNGDGIDDLIVGALFYENHAGRTYIVFGKNTGWNSSFELSSLNGNNGFILNSIDPGEESGRAVSAGDVNGDGISDLIISADIASILSRGAAGRTYVVFGKNTGWNSSFELSSLNGNNGFILNGEAASDHSGYSVSAGDVNGDGFADVIVGAIFAGGNHTGRTYIVFGKDTDWISPFELSSLNGSNGFILNGETTGDISGRSVSNGDVNGDGFADVIIGAPYHQDYTGRIYIVFGKSTDWSSPLELSSLNGSNGFILNGEVANDMATGLVSAGDVNGDGFADVIIGSFNANPNDLYNAGRVYVVFGKSVGWSSPLELADLNGSNGFILNGKAANEHLSGYSLSASDVNGDGISDMIVGTCNYQKAAGYIYVVFGKNTGWSSPFELSNLNGGNGFILNGNQAIDSYFVVASRAGDVNNDSISDLVIGFYRATTNGQPSAGRSYVVFSDVAPQLVNNYLNIGENQTLLFNSSYLSACDRNHNNATLVFQLYNVTNGYAELIDNSGVPITTFQQQQIWNGQVQFVAVGKLAPAYAVQVQSSGLALSPSAEWASVNFIPAPTIFSSTAITSSSGIDTTTCSAAGNTNTSTQSSSSSDNVSSTSSTLASLTASAASSTATGQEIYSASVISDSSSTLPESTVTSSSAVDPISNEQISSTVSSTFSESSSSFSAFVSMSSTPASISSSSSRADHMSTIESSSLSSFSSMSDSSSDILSTIDSSSLSSPATNQETSASTPSDSSVVTANPFITLSSVSDLSLSSMATIASSSGIYGAQAGLVNNPSPTSSDQTVKIVSIVVPVGGVALLAGLGMFCKYQLRKAEVEAEKQKAITQEKYLALQIERERNKTPRDDIQLSVQQSSRNGSSKSSQQALINGASDEQSQYQSLTPSR